MEIRIKVLGIGRIILLLFGIIGGGIALFTIDKKEDYIKIILMMVGCTIIFIGGGFWLRKSKKDLAKIKESLDNKNEC